MRHVRAALLGSLLFASDVFAATHAAPDVADGPTAEQAYRQLVDGHARYATDTRTLPHQSESRRCETTAGGQHPVAAVLTCADSRVPPEMLFDQGIGDLFVVRVAGNVAAADELGSIEYGVAHLHIPLIVVLGHTRCGAVTAVVDGAHAEGNLAQLLKPITPAADRARHTHPTLNGPALVAAAIQENVRQAMQDLTARSPALAEAVTAKRVKIVGGVYDIHAGRIDWLDATAATEPTAPARLPVDVPSPGHDDHAHSPAPAPHAAATPAHDDHVTPHGKPAPAQDSRAADHSTPAPARHEAADSHHADNDRPAVERHREASPAAPAPSHTANTPPTAKPPAAEAHTATRTSITDHWPVLAGAVVASTLIGAGVSHLAARTKA